ncbi:MAG: hypothetical protein PHO70_06710 [Candidatus Omnitrophica bacterium]|nr:hypothetical protein [Candidatus Omnitrophota bacterium]
MAGKKIKFSNSLKDLIVIVIIVIVLFILSFFFNLFLFLVELFQKNPSLAQSIDEIIVLLLTLSICFGIFSLRRWSELKKETSRRLKLQEELLRNAETRAETERIISKQLRCEVEDRKEAGKNKKS